MLLVPVKVDSVCQMWLTGTPRPRMAEGSSYHGPHGRQHSHMSPSPSQEPSCLLWSSKSPVNEILRGGDRRKREDLQGGGLCVPHSHPRACLANLLNNQAHGLLQTLPGIALLAARLVVPTGHQYPMHTSGW